MKILKMIEDKIITAEEGLKLLDAIEDNERYETKREKIKMRGKKLIVKVLDKEENTNVDIKIPLSLVNLGLNIGSKFSPNLKEKMGNVDIDDIIKTAIEDLNEDGNQKIVDIHEENGTTVEIYIE
ncbi:MAG: hypothetical protein JW702_01040 [Clostridiales bacterium]|nr:hypothetical protein [Clostridiales bacterium]